MEIEIDMRDLPKIQQRSIEELIDRHINENHYDLDEMLDRFRNTIIVRALAINDKSIVRTARSLGIKTSELVSWMEKYGIEA